ncbi:15506_t:CDS:2 [Funneliformis mosseae]|uniref:15506_t:CDS:1 n=1 Tax=Funneliformis mosseae TaxID=27381 RepID=A0A9N9FEL5_FUNMO|nr:15506_t:CDS:2 [Funneliformis mosseae]
MLTRRFSRQDRTENGLGEIYSWVSAQRRNEGYSITLRARMPRSGGLPEPHRKKIFSDSLDLSITMRDILHSFFKSNASSPDQDLHKIFILGVQSWGIAKGQKFVDMESYPPFYMQQIKLEFIEKIERKKIDKNMPTLRLGAVLGKITETPISKKSQILEHDFPFIPECRGYKFISPKAGKVLVKDDEINVILEKEKNSIMNQVNGLGLYNEKGEVVKSLWDGSSLFDEDGKVTIKVKLEVPSDTQLPAKFMLKTSSKIGEALACKKLSGNFTIKEHKK